ncbi:MAG: glycosyltransferase family 39 protein [bacterium]|nr:glycosyltransferase family 39 protein [bacterium]
MFLIIGLLLTFALGYLLTLVLDAKLAIYERLCLSFVIGLGVMTQLLFLLDIIHINYSAFSVLSSLLILNVLLIFLIRKKLPRVRDELNLRILTETISWVKRLSILEKIFLLTLIFLILGAFVRAVFWPVYYWDSLALYDYRGRIFTDAHGIAKSVAFSSIQLHTYPPMTSLAHAFVYILGGKFANPQFIYPVFYLSLIVTFYYSVRKYVNQWASLLFAVFLASTPLLIEFSANAYTNLPYALYFGLGTIYLYRFMVEKSAGFLLISGFLLGLSGWTRSPTEQFFLANLIVLSLWSIKQRPFYWAPVVLLCLYSILAIPWRFYTLYVLHISPIGSEITSAVKAGATVIDLSRLWTVLIMLFQSLKGVSGASVGIVIISLLFFPYMFRRHLPLLFFLALNLIVFVLGSYAFSLSWPDWKDSIANSANRLSMFFIPIALFYGAISIPNFLLSKNKKGELK